MRLYTCESCARPFKRTRARQSRCTSCSPPGRADRSPTTRAQDAEYTANRKTILAPAPVCHWGCGRPAATADHLLPVSRGGSNRLENLVPACRPCNSARQADPDWRPAAAQSTTARLPPTRHATPVRLS